MNRILGIVITVVWVAAMAALVARDMIPFWRAQEPPSQLATDEDRQVGIVDSRGRRLGTTWITTRRTPSEITVQSSTLLNLAGVLPMLRLTKDVLIDNTLTYGPDGGVDQFDFAVHGAEFPIHITGERYGADFACKATLAGMTHTIPLDARLSSYLGETLRPFTHLAGLHVGQSWRLRLLDPIALLIRQQVEFDVRLVTVTAREPIQHGNETVDCFRVETEGSVAWADDRGRVLRQEIEMPIIGKWVLVDEPFDASARAKARAMIQNTGRRAPP